MLLVSIISGVLVFLVFGLLFFLADAFFGKEDFASSHLAVDRVVKIIKERHLEKGQLYDLGSCRGSFAVKIASAFPGMKIIGIDDSWFRTLFSKTRGIFLKNVSFRKANIFKSDISSADIIYVYLPQELMPDLQTKLKKELKAGNLVIANRVTFPNWQPAETLSLDEIDQVRGGPAKLFLYQIP